MIPPGTILLVDDRPARALPLAHALERMGYGVQVAHGAEQALRLMALDRPRAVVARGEMERVDGYELCRRVRSSPPLHDLPVAIIAKLVEPSIILRVLDAGADDLIPTTDDGGGDAARVERALAAAEGPHTLEEPVERAVEFGGSVRRVRTTNSRLLALLLGTFEHAAKRLGAIEEVNDRLVEALRAMERLQEDYCVALQANADAIIICDHEGIIRFANQAALTLYDVEARPFVGFPFGNELVEGETSEVEVERSSGRCLIAEMRISRTHWEGEVAFLASLRDVTERIQKTQELRNIAYRDELTGLYNRRGFLLLASVHLGNADTHGAPLELFYCDMDGMKWINDELGHDEGDRALVDIADILRKSFRTSDLIARLGGDEFAVIATNVDPGAEEIIARRIQTEVETHNREAGRPYQLGLSTGSVTYDPSDPVDLEALMKRADGVMYEEKRRRKGSRGGVGTRGGQ